MAPSLKAVFWPGLLLLGASSAVATLAWAARQATSPVYKRRYDITALAISDKEIELPADRHTLAPGTFGLQLAEEGAIAVIGPVISAANGKVRRRLLHRPAALSLESKGRWSGIVSMAPSQATVETSISTPLGPAPVWIVEGRSDRWAIHVHGQGSDRRQTLRGVESATALGLTSLVISYRNDGEGPRSEDGRSHLGESEWQDLDAALRFVAQQGGTDCIIFGWSLGATMATNTLHRSAMGGMIKGIVMVSPVLSWHDVLRANARHQGWPRFLGSLVAGFLSNRDLSRLAGLDRPLNVIASDQDRLNGALTAPVLILHNKNDWSVPIETSVRFKKTHRGLVELVEFDCSGHTQEWNSDPVGWDLAVRRWYGKLFQPDQPDDRAVTDGR